MTTIYLITKSMKVNNTFNSNDVFTSDVFEGEISESDIPF